MISNFILGMVSVFRLDVEPVQRNIILKNDNYLNHAIGYFNSAFEKLKEEYDERK